MANIFPERLPENVIHDPMRRAERAMYESLSRLPDSFDVFYSVAWQSRNFRNVRDGEADFVVTHPEKGLLVIEVKGGSISFDAATGQWYSGIYPINDPIVQATNNQHELVRKLEEMPEWTNEYLTSGHAVAFPDVLVENTNLRLDLPREIVLDHASVANMEGEIRRVFDYYSGESGRPNRLGAERMIIIRKLLARSFHIKALPQAQLKLGDVMKEEVQRLIALTERQMMILDFLRTRRRAAIKGCAGSGKTMLALEKARRLASEGFEVLLTCYNFALAEYLAKIAPEGVTVMHFHGLCRELVKDAGFMIRPVKNEKELYNIVLPKMLIEAVSKTGPMFDAIIVDEGQDFEEDWWLSLVNLLHDQDQGILFVFYDDNQNLYRGSNNITMVVEEAPYPLIDNCRNTQKIHQLVSAFHQEGSQLRCPGPLGRPATIHSYTDSKDMQRQIGALLHHLIKDDGIAVDDIAILTPRAQERSALKAGSILGNFSLTTADNAPGMYQVKVSSIHSFKGLERQVIILAELDNAMGYSPDEVLYVGCSRARTQLILLHDKSWNMEATTKVKAHAG